MKSIITTVAVASIFLAAHGLGYWQGVRSSQERAMLEGARYAAKACVVQNLVELREVTRAVEARNRKPLIVECRR